MALSDTDFATELKNLFDWMEVLGDGGEPKTKEQIALKMAEVINAQIKTLDAKIQMPAAKVIVSVSGGSGAPAVGTANVSPIDLTQVSIT
jgi:hypothetical protein